MRRYLLVVFALVTLVPGLFANQKDRDREAAALQDRAKALSDIRVHGAPPFRLKVTFKIWRDDGSVAEGTYTELWVSSAQWRKEFVAGDFRRTQVVVGHKSWTLDSGPVEPEGLNNIPSLLNPMGWLSDAWKPESVQDRTIDGVALRCFSAKTSFGKAESCFDKNNGSLTMHVSPIALKPNVDSTYSYSDYRRFGDHMVPTSYNNVRDQKIRSQARVEELTFSPEFDQGIFTPLAGAKESGHCPGRAQPATVVHRIDPASPRKGDESVTILATIDEKGTVRDLKIVKSVDKDYDRAALEAVSAWRFKPATCEGEAFATQIAIVLDFHYH